MLLCLIRPKTQFPVFISQDMKITCCLPFVVHSYLRDPLASIHVIEKCGHVCNIERADEFNRVSLSFLNSYPNLTRLEHIPENTRAYRIKQKLQNNL